MVILFVKKIMTTKCSKVHCMTIFITMKENCFSKTSIIFWLKSLLHVVKIIIYWLLESKDWL